MGVDNPAPAVTRDGATVAPSPTGSRELVSHYLPVFHWWHMPESANRVQQSVTVNKQLTGMRGVYLVAAELSGRGFIASPTARSAREADILCTDLRRPSARFIGICRCVGLRQICA